MIIIRAGIAIPVGVVRGYEGREAVGEASPPGRQRYQPQSIYDAKYLKLHSQVKRKSDHGKSIDVDEST
jgi:hypothetical protein